MTDETKSPDVEETLHGRALPQKVGSLTVVQPSIESYRLKMLIYGPPGVGKTTLAASANAVKEMAPVLVVSVEAGTLSLAGLPWTPSIVELTNYRQLGEIFNFLRSERNPFRTVVVDSLSELQLVNLDGIVRERTKGKESSEIYLADYGDSTRQMRAAVQAFRNLPLHVIFTAAEASSQDDTQAETVYPALSAKLRTAVIGYMDVMGYLTTARPEAKPGEKPRVIRRLFTQPYGKIQAKDRTPGGRLGVWIDNPSMGAILGKIYQKEQSGG